MRDGAVYRRLLWFFFFQAEDGIRDLTVTGVQTCALPISGVADLRVPLLPRRHPAADGLADASRSVDEAFLLEDVEHGERRRLCDRVEIGRASCRERV